MQNMAGSNAEIETDRNTRTWEHNSTRQAILDAARRVAARDGVEAMTLSRVAAEAGFAPPAVYAYFVSKDDLHLAVVADDLSTLARAMRGENDAEEAQADPTAAEVEIGEPESDADVIALHPAGQPDEVPPAADAAEAADHCEQRREDESAGDCESLAGEAAEAFTADMAGQHEADGENEGAADSDAPASGAMEEISLAEIEQAIGVVLAAPDAHTEFCGEIYTADAEAVPDAFPEEAIAEDAADPQSAPAVERRAEPEPSGSGRRSRRRAAAEEPPVPLFETPAASAARTFASAEEMAAAIGNLEQMVARLEARPVDAWLERRLRVFERTLADIESRMEKTERDSATALSTVSEGFKALEHRFDETSKGADQRGAESEQRYRAVTADLRMYVKDLSSRLSAAETRLSRVAGEADDVLMARAESRAALLRAGDDDDDDGGAVTAVTPAAALAVDAAPDDAPAGAGTGATHGYLSAARRAAQSAAADALAARERGRLGNLKLPALGQGHPIPRRTLQLVAAGLTLVVVLIVANIAMKGRATASVPQAAMPVASIALAPSPDERVAALARSGNAKAALIVALKFLNGDGVASDVRTATHWLEVSARQNEPLAQYWLGTLYERGRGVPKDSAKAMQWYEAAAKAGNAKAMYRLGVAYAEGWNGEPDYVPAAQWFTKAANFGVIDAQYNLAVLYERGEGVPQSLTDAFQWYAIAAGQGDAESKSRLDALASQIGASGVALAQKAASAFSPAEPVPSANSEPDTMAVAGMK